MQTSLFEAPPPPVPDLARADLLLANSSAGKDSQAMLHHLVQLADAAGVLDRMHVVHCDLGDVEWPGTRDLAAAQAHHYGLPFHVRKRAQGDLLTQIADRHHRLRARGDTTTPAWPSSAARYCTSDQKRGPVRILITELVAALGLDRPAHIINCLGLRAAESAARARRSEIFAIQMPHPSLRASLQGHGRQMDCIHAIQPMYTQPTMNSNGRKQVTRVGRTYHETRSSICSTKDAPLNKDCRTGRRNTAGEGATPAVDSIFSAISDMWARNILIH
ncbi:hypothetical protein [Streptomyces sp. NPDC059787]|uniref:hypothetical protein n=1 Tax=Streptomyces sp. NPDC059787 TaxID=3346947 RepID=UPI003654CBEF